MSIILDALNKADDERNPQESTTENIENSAENASSASEPAAAPQTPATPNKVPAMAPVVAKKSSKTLPILIVLLLASLIGAGGYFGMKWYKGLFTSTKPLVSKNTNPIQTNLPLEVKEDPKDKIPGLKNIAGKLYDKKNYEQSIKVWKQVIGIDETESEAFNNLGMSYRKLNQVENAKKAYLKALQINSDYPEALNNLGTILLEEKGQELKAYSLFKKASKINQDYAPAHFHLALLMERKGEFDLALQHFEKFIKYSDKLPESVTSKVQMRMTLLKAQL